MTTVRDPVCGMCVPEERGTVTRVYRGRTYGFCCDNCSDAFGGDPERFVGGDADPDDGGWAAPDSATP